MGEGLRPTSFIACIVRAFACVVNIWLFGLLALYWHEFHSFAPPENVFIRLAAAVDKAAILPLGCARSYGRECIYTYIYIYL